MIFRCFSPSLQSSLFADSRRFNLVNLSWPFGISSDPLTHCGRVSAGQWKVVSWRICALKKTQDECPGTSISTIKCNQRNPKRWNSIIWAYLWALDIQTTMLTQRTTTVDLGSLQSSSTECCGIRASNRIIFVTFGSTGPCCLLSYSPRCLLPN